MTILRKRDVTASDPISAAEEHIKTIAEGTEFAKTDSYTSPDTGITHVHFVQTYNGVVVENARANVNVAKDNSIFSSGISFVKGEIKASAVTKRDLQIGALKALKGAIKALDLPIKADKAKEVEGGSGLIGRRSDEVTIKNVEGVVSDPVATSAYYNVNGELKLIWKIEADIDENWLLIYADALKEGIVYSVADYVADAQYNVYPFGVNDPTEGSRQLVTDPANLVTSPNGYHKVGSTSYTVTRGNNGIAQENWSGSTSTTGYLTNQRPSGGSSNIYNFPYDISASDPKTYINASVTQLFYTSNVYHDLLEALGFTEAAGNFEDVNTSGQGRGNDAVQLNAQDGSGTNNANFATPADGQRPRMRMYLWNAVPGAKRDCSFDAGVVIHEYTHGLSNRLTGGASNSACLSTSEGRGMGEGWSDFFATAVRIKAGDTRNTNYAMGDWVNGAGIRRYPYSVSMTTNPTTYALLDDSSWKSGAPHTFGSIWANMLYEVLWNLIDKYGYTENRFPVFASGSALPTKGVPAAMKIVLEGLKLQPCQPTFITARNAILDADVALSGGANKCEIWRPFAKRGLGTDATLVSGVHKNGFALPSGC
ncbi:extracellular metallo proteinase MEP [Ascobolus immersus RN42]|uniref:Extracellular metalloproteinase n=1 Tax=Ascobolus immersus RN42 TaxID=1160509 RepID=A0A3N4HEG0_ASCIM|nr:extracellular metallo proteinase MEP [Ascobolus immersus RN42]